MSYRPAFSTEISSEQRNESVDMENLNVFDSKRIGNIVTLTGDVAYHITNNFSWEELEFVVDPTARITFSTSNTVANGINTTIASGRTLFSGALSRIDFIGTDIVSANGGDCFNFTAAGGVFPVLFLSKSRIQGFDKVGTTVGISIALENIGYVFNSDGWDITNAAILQIAEQNVLLSSGISYKMSGTTGSVFYNTVESAPISVDVTFDISGTVGAAFFNTIKVKPVSGGSVFNIDSGITVTGAFQIVGGSVDTSAGGVMFKAGSLDQTDPKILVDNVSGTPSSYKVGLMAMIGNTTTTVINTVGVYEDIAGTIVGAADNQRFTFSTDTLTYTGREDIIAAIDVSLFKRRDIAAASRVMKFGLFLNGVLSQEFEATMSDAITNSSFPTGINLVTGDTLKMKVQNTQDTSDIVITTFDFRVIEA